MGGNISKTCEAKMGILEVVVAPGPANKKISVPKSFLELIELLNSIDFLNVYKANFLAISLVAAFYTRVWQQDGGIN